MRWLMYCIGVCRAIWPITGVSKNKSAEIYPLVELTRSITGYTHSAIEHVLNRRTQ